MRSILAILFLSAALYGVEPEPPSPTPVPKDRHEEISRVMLKLQQAQMAQVQAQATVDSATSEYRSLLDKLRKEFNAPGCDLDIAKEWHCAAPVPLSLPPSPPASK
jgi:hypothetical protein